MSARHTRTHIMSAAPGVTDDSKRLKVSEGDLWFNSSTNQVYILVDGTPGAAVWQPLQTGNAQSVTPDDAEGTGNTIYAHVTAVDVGAVTNDANDFIVLPSLADVPVGHKITVVCNAGGNFEIRTPADSDEEINSEDSDATKEYLATDTEIITFVKISNTIGWMGTATSAIGTDVTAVVPD